VIEVGTFKGVTTRRLSYFFDRVISIEIDPKLHELAKQKCRGRSNIELLLGDGAVILPLVAARTKNSIIYLDGHYSGGETGTGDEPEPVLKDLDLVAAHFENISAIIIDDFRLFGLEPGWPLKYEVFKKLEALFSNDIWNITVFNDQFLIMRKR
jgi:Ribosomal RNA adenine dimethylase